MRVGDYWLLVFLGEEVPGQYLAGDGDVYVAVLDDDFETMETIKVSDNTDGSGLGSARPSFARHMDKLTRGLGQELPAAHEHHHARPGRLRPGRRRQRLRSLRIATMRAARAPTKGTPLEADPHPAPMTRRAGPLPPASRVTAKTNSTRRTTARASRKIPATRAAAVRTPPRAQVWPGPASLGSWPSEDGEADLLCVAVEEGVVRL